MNRKPKALSGTDILKSTIELIKVQEAGCLLFHQLQNWDYKAKKIRGGETSDETDWRAIENLREMFLEPLQALMKDNPLINAAELIAEKKNDKAWIAWREAEENIS